MIQVGLSEQRGVPIYVPMLTVRVDAAAVGVDVPMLVSTLYEDTLCIITELQARKSLSVALFRLDLLKM